MKEYLAKVQVSNGRFWRERPFRVKASNIRVAFTRAATYIKKVVPPRTHVAGVTIQVTPIKPVHLKDTPDGKLSAGD